MRSTRVLFVLVVTLVVSTLAAVVVLAAVRR
ncbi:hypothetical protein SAMN05421867_11761 [Cellulomonas marina]|uniref:Uncharacterized protein n=1 Tax=Cellulomonas marina TaxID=988821 RepID=A0A1I1AE27_9CELL|nr:hypothetical protein SAMN05421867_11761 [Cellulomonas marina]